jgi:ADP-ribosylglycohydrolase
MKVTLTAEQLDRAQGVLLGTAAGDALGAGYEFGPPLDDDAPVAMNGGGPFGWAPGEWTDDTSMALAIAEVAASGADLRERGAQDAIVARWAGWATDAADVGSQTRQVLAGVSRASGANGAAAAARAAARQLHEATGRSAGNGSLMRTAPVALAYLGDPGGLAGAAAALSALTHYDRQAGEACVLWCLAIRHAVLTGELDARAGLAGLPESRRGGWSGLLAGAERGRPRDFDQNGWVVHALQGAWSAITAARPGQPGQLRHALEAAVRGGRDTDTVAAIAGGLAGAACGAGAVPAQWREKVHGWPGLRAAGLAELTAAIVGLAVLGAAVLGGGGAGGTGGGDAGGAGGRARRREQEVPGIQHAADLRDHRHGEQQVETGVLAAGEDGAAGGKQQHDHDVDRAAVEDRDEKLVVVVQGVLHPPDAQQYPAGDQADDDQLGAEHPVRLARRQQRRRHHQRRDEQHQGLRRARPQALVAGDPAGVQRHGDEQQPGQGAAHSPGHLGEVLPVGRGHRTRHLLPMPDFTVIPRPSVVPAASSGRGRDTEKPTGAWGHKAPAGRLGTLCG